MSDIYEDFRMVDEHTIIVDNPSGLALAALDEFVLFQGDLKRPIHGQALAAFKQSIKEHRVFIGKAAAKLNGELLTEDGHQS